MPADKTPPAAPAEWLGAAIALSGRMVEAARAGDWDRLSILEHERSQLLHGNLAARLSHMPGGASADVKAALAACLRLNDEIAAITGAHMARLSELLSEMAQPAGRNGPPQRPPG